MSGIGDASLSVLALAGVAVALLGLAALAVGQTCRVHRPAAKRESGVAPMKPGDCCPKCGVGILVDKGTIIIAGVGLTVDCRECNGRGPPTCTTCHGAGTLEVDTAALNECSQCPEGRWGVVQ